MTFLLQKYNAISRTQVRESLRSFASGVASTSRLAVTFLLLAGFLGVGSAMAQNPPTILRLGGGAVTLEAGSLTSPLAVHHYVVNNDDDTKTDNPFGLQASGASNASASPFAIGSIAVVSSDANGDLTIRPLATTGSFKIALSPDATMDMTNDDADDNTNEVVPHEYVVYSTNAPMLTGKTDPIKTYNQQAAEDNEPIMLTPRDKISEVVKDAKDKPVNITMLFTDPDDVSLTYTATADPVKKMVDGEDVDTEIVTATIDANKNTLTIALTDKAEANDVTDVWLIAADGAGEQARKRYHITTGSSSNPYVTEKGLEDVDLREDDMANTMITLAEGFADADLALDANNTQHDFGDGTPGSPGTARALSIEVTKISDMSAQKIPGGDTQFTWVAAALTAKVTGNGGDAPMIDIDPRAKGTVTFTVKATDKGAICRANDNANEDGTGNQYILIKAKADADGIAQMANLGDTGDDAPAMCWADAVAADGTAADSKAQASETTVLYPDSEDAMTTFTVNVVSMTTPEADAAIPPVTLVSDTDVAGKTVDLADVDVETAGDQPAFKDYMQALMYTVKVDKEDVVMATAEGSLIKIVPIWRTLPDAMVKVTVTATNGSMESAETMFDVTIKAATKPVVNPIIEENPQVAGALTQGFMVAYGKKLTVDLTDLRGAIKEQLGGGAEGDEALAALLGEAAKDAFPLFIDPNATPDDQLPGGLELRIDTMDVATAHRYDDLSMLNDISTSMGRLVLNPKTAMLTFSATAPSTMTVTIHGTDRERNMVSAMTTITVLEVTSAEVEELPKEVGLSQNYPNPFNPQTTIEYALPEAGDVSLIVYDMLGREVTTLLNGPQTAGRHAVNFDAAHLSNGTYVYRLVAPNKTITRTMVLVK